MEGRALEKYLRISPRKVRQVVALIRGKGTEEAVRILKFTRKNASSYVEKAIQSAVANLLFIHPEVERESLYVKEVFVNGGPMFKRGRAGSMGRRSMIRKRSSHITVIVADRSETTVETVQS
jgi:large subunit ribosomal protein L22